jgi:predicted phage terminase large subunit-like protein
MNRDLLYSIARDDFATFARCAFAVVNPGTPFVQNWHHHAISHQLLTMQCGGHCRQIIAMPPRSLKSFLASVAWPAFLLGRNPSEKIIVASYSDGLAVQLSNDTRLLMESPLYKKVFPGVVLTKSTKEHLVTTANGMRLATSVGGTLTGFGANWIIIDDPHNTTEANSAAAREDVKKFYGGTASTRLNDPATGKIVVVMQRVHQDDLAGHLLDQGGWEHLKLQAVATDAATVPVGPATTHQVSVGDLLDPVRLPNNVLEMRKREMGSLAYQAQYQQEPVPADGATIKRHWLRYYDQLPSRDGARIVLSLDTAIKTGPANDFSACTAWLQKDGKSYLIDVWREKVEFPELKRKAKALWHAHGAIAFLIEDQGSGSSLIQELGGEGIAAIGCKTRDGKEVRITAATVAIEAGLMWLPLDAPWLAAFETELLGFPVFKHDDQVDAVSQYFNWARPGPPCLFEFDAMTDDMDDPLDFDLIAQHLLWRRTF